eukprot:1139694-Pelagomonas_calceolata.AAC.3
MLYRPPPPAAGAQHFSCGEGHCACACMRGKQGKNKLPTDNKEGARAHALPFTTCCCRDPAIQLWGGALCLRVLKRKAGQRTNSRQKRKRGQGRMRFIITLLLRQRLALAVLSVRLGKEGQAIRKGG